MWRESLEYTITDVVAAQRVECPGAEVSYREASSWEMLLAEASLSLSHGTERESFVLHVHVHLVM
jgi:hypothetical protein